MPSIPFPTSRSLLDHTIREFAKHLEQQPGRLLSLGLTVQISPLGAPLLVLQARYSGVGEPNENMEIVNLAEDIPSPDALVAPAPPPATLVNELHNQIGEFRQSLSRASRKIADLYNENQSLQEQLSACEKASEAARAKAYREALQAFDAASERTEERLADEISRLREEVIDLRSQVRSLRDA
jgi:hypothetical protein